MKKLGGRLNIAESTRPSQTDARPMPAPTKRHGGRPRRDEQRGGARGDDECEEQQRADHLHRDRHDEGEQKQEHDARAP